MGLDITYYRQATSPTEQQAAALQQFPEDDRRWTLSNLVLCEITSERPAVYAESSVLSEASMRCTESAFSTQTNVRFVIRHLCARGRTKPRWRSAGPSGGSPVLTHSPPDPRRPPCSPSPPTYFSDCEGVIGPVVSAKLAKDFALYQPFADSHSDEWFRKKYAEWRVAFETAADGGFVDFH